MAQRLLEEFFESNDGVLRVSAASKLGISAPTIYAFARAHGLERVSKGVYVDPEGNVVGLPALATRDFLQLANNLTGSGP